jgi:hypothetical protein
MKIGSFKEELLVKSREMLSAVQILTIKYSFKSENFIILANITWIITYFTLIINKRLNIDILDKQDKGKKFDKTNAFKC